tara:strand:- start:49313 stop:50020 length:708 start_codon:yes stop_codon:yes gene_type:complete
VKVKYVKRTAVIRNAILLEAMSVYFLFVLESLKIGSSALRPILFVTFIFDNIYFVSFCLMTILFQFLGYKIAKLCFWISSLYILYIGTSIFYETFDKPILILTSLFLVLSYFTYLVWDKELKEAAYSPKFNLNSIYKKSHYTLPTVLNAPFGRCEGYLTNWDSEGCFFYSENENIGSGNVELVINYENIEFKTLGKVITRYGNGVGVRIKPSKDSSSPDWNDFYDIISSRGYGAV